MAASLSGGTDIEVGARYTFDFIKGAPSSIGTVSKTKGDWVKIDGDMQVNLDSVAYID